MKRGIIVLIISSLAIWIFTVCYSMFKNEDNNESKIFNWHIEIIPSLDDTVLVNTIRGGNLEILRNDIKNDIAIRSQSSIFNNLDNQLFNSDHLPSKFYYNAFWLISLNLKSEIEKWVKDQFNENLELSKFLNWSIVPQDTDYYEWKKEKRYMMYTKLKKDINLWYAFEKLKDWDFADISKWIKYFGINCHSNIKHASIKILYYNSDSDFAVSIATHGWDNIILYRWVRWNSYIDTYNKILSQSKAYKWDHEFSSYDCLKIPEININTKKEIKKFKNQKFSDNNETYKIQTAIQDIEVKFDKIVWTQNDKSLLLPNNEWSNYRLLYFDEPFMIFIKEFNKEVPYFVAQISDITLFQ